MQVLAKLYQLVDRNGPVPGGGENFDKMCRSWVTGLVQGRGQEFGVGASTLNYYMHAIRDHLGEMVINNEGRGLRMYKCSNFERENLTESKALRSSNSRRPATMCMEMLCRSLRVVFREVSTCRQKVHCTDCCKGFAHAGNLKNHQHDHHGDKHGPAPPKAKRPRKCLENRGKKHELAGDMWAPIASDRSAQDRPGSKHC